MEEIFGEYISMYTRKEALSDGELIDISEKEEAGFKFLVAVTRVVRAEVIQPDEKALAMGESESGCLRGILLMAHIAIKRGDANGQFMD